MDDHRLEDILQRLDAIEHYLERHSAWHQDDHRSREHCSCGCHHRHEHRRREGQDDHGFDGRRGDGHCGCKDRKSEGFDEKRIVDLIVRLVTEKVDELFCRYEQRRAAAEKPPADPTQPPAASSGSEGG